MIVVDIESEPVVGHRVMSETLGLLLDFAHHNVPLGAVAIKMSRCDQHAANRKDLPGVSLRDPLAST
jgi:hypothetical protein